MYIPEYNFDIDMTTDSGRAFVYDPKGVDQAAFISGYSVGVALGKKEVLIKVIAAGLNPVDYKLPQAMPMALLRGKPWGQDVCGKVTRVGSKVTSFAVDDVVCGFGRGLAEYAVVSCSEIVKVPEGVPHEVAGSLGVAGLTAYQMLKCNGAFEGTEPKSILVIGASGGVGSLVVQIARALCVAGTTIHGMCSARSAEFVKSLGVDAIIDYTVPGFSLAAALPAGSVDVVADCVTSPDDYDYVPEGMPLIKPKTGKYVAINSSSKMDWVKCIAGSKLGIRMFRGQYSLLLCTHDARDLESVVGLIRDGKLRVHIHSKETFDETSIRKAYAELKGRRVHGKVVVVM